MQANKPTNKQASMQAPSQLLVAVDYSVCRRREENAKKQRFSIIPIYTHLTKSSLKKEELGSAFAVRLITGLSFCGYEKVNLQ